MSSRVADVLVFALLVAACQTPAEPAQRATVTGTVVSGPSCPVLTEPPDPACDDRPVADAEMVILDATGNEVTRVQTDPAGRFSVELGAGEYRIVPQPVEGLMGTPPEVVIVVHETDVDVGFISYDTGVR